MQVKRAGRRLPTPKLPKPRMVGRLVRLLLGVGTASMLLLTSPTELNHPDGLFWFLALYAFLSLPDVFDVLLSRRLRVNSQLLFLALVAIATAANLIMYKQIWAPILAILVYGMIVVVIGALTISFLLAALLRTPGCEWRAIPHLLARLKGQDIVGHPCSIYLHKLDQWEARHSKGK